MKTILIIGSGPLSLRIANIMKGNGLSKELIFLPGNENTLKIGQNVIIPHLGENGVSDCKEIGETCFTERVDIVLVCPEHISDLGLADYFGKDERISKIEIIGPIKPAGYWEDKDTWYMDQYFQQVKKLLDEKVS